MRAAASPSPASRFPWNHVKLTRLLILVFLAIAVTAGVAVAGSVLRFGPALRVAVADAGGQAPSRNVDHRKVGADDQCNHCHLARHKAPLAGPCEDCHTTSTWESSKRSHETTSMDAGPHESLRCVQCHRNPNRLPRPSCKSCHRTVAHRWEPKCDRCHAVSVWSKTDLVSPETHVVRARRHERLRCPDCHATYKAETPALRCTECHKKHTEKFPRTTGPHKKPACVKCHDVTPVRDNFNVTSVKGDECAKCHKPRHQGYPRCQECHKARFKGTAYDHDENWPLTGEHARVACARCHADLQWKPLPPKRCAACHSRRHTGLTDCARCHTTSGFGDQRFRHATVYPLKGAHSRVVCSRCHPGGDIGRVRGTTCVQCHGARHGGLTACSSCHTAESFAPATFKHDKAWRKTGVHAKTACSACHPKKQYAKAKGTVCVQCHGVKHGGQKRCDACHSTYGWSPIKDVSHSSKYPLQGMHRYVDCVACHKNLQFAGTPRRCVDCHADLAHEHGHTACEKCHTPRSWKIILPHDMSDCE